MRRAGEYVIEKLLTVSGAVTGLTMLTITVFLFKEGAGLFRSPSVEKGYALYVHAENPVERLSVNEIKGIFDGEITVWNALSSDYPHAEIVPYRIEDIFQRYSESELGEDYALLPDKLAEVIRETSGIIAFLPQQYAPTGMTGVKTLPSQDIRPADFFGGTSWMPTATPAPLFGVLPLILGTLFVSIVAILIALPLGLSVAIFLSELAGTRTRKWMKPAIELLAGIPSVVYGFFGLVVLVPLVQRAFALPVGETAFTGSLILAIMALPTIITVAEDAMRNTPRELREASLALGAGHWQTIRKVIIPYASSGISAAVVLGIGRAIGETMAVLMVTGNAAVMPHSLFESVRTIPATIAAELGEAPAGGAHYQALFVLGCVLFLLTLLISVSAEWMAGKQSSKIL
ncbi:MAG: phosphate ABC transporter permease subunit PstC [Prevotellaceae bacterium]|nr:phosphate ABC transporter permease subunit PstC [Prevotellaceae bacterium]